MSYYKLSFGCFWFSIDGTMLVIGVDRTRLAAYAAKEGLPIPAPKLRPQRPDHLSIPLKPRINGRDAGKICIHLTYNDADPRKRHEFIAALDPREMERTGAALQSAYVESQFMEGFLRGAYRVDPNWLIERGYAIMFFEEESFVDVARAEFKRKARQYAVRPNRFSEYVRAFINVANFGFPTILEDEAFIANAPRQVAAMYIGDSEPAQPALVLMYSPYGFAGGEPGWYVMPEYDTRSEAARQDFVRSFGWFFSPKVVSFITTVVTEMGIPFEIETLERLFSIEASGVSTPPPPSSSAGAQATSA